MKFQSRIIGFPIYLLAEETPAPTMSTYLKLTAFPQLTQTKAANFTNAKAWFQVQRKAPFTNTMFTNPKLALTSYDRDSTLFDIELTNGRRINGQYLFDCTAKLDNNWIAFTSEGLILVQQPASFVIITTCGDSIADGGNFLITDGAGNYALTTKDSGQYPLFGVTNKPNKASNFMFSWTGFKSLRELITLFLRARYYLDHRKILYNNDKYDEIKQVYNDIGQIIIKQITGNRRESVYYKDYGFMPNKMDGYNSSNKQTTQKEGFMDIKVELDDWRHPYPPFTVMPYVVKDMDSFADNILAGSKPSVTSQSSNDGVDFQRSVTYESSDNAFDEVTYDNAVDAGIIANAKKVLETVAIQTYAWSKIDQAVSPIGGSNNVWPAVLIINGNNIGVNFLHPVISGSLLGSNPLFYFSPNDGNVRDRTSTGVFVVDQKDSIRQVPTFITDVPADAPAGEVTTEPERMCPCGSGGYDSEKKEGFSCGNMTPIQFLILLIFVIILALVTKVDKILFGDLFGEEARTPIV